MGTEYNHKILIYGEGQHVASFSLVIIFMSGKKTGHLRVEMGKHGLWPWNVGNLILYTSERKKRWRKEGKWEGISGSVYVTKFCFRDVSCFRGAGGLLCGPVWGSGETARPCLSAQLGPSGHDVTSLRVNMEQHQHSFIHLFLPFSIFFNIMSH